MFIQTSHDPCGDQKQWVTMSLTRMEKGGATSVRHQVTSPVRTLTRSNNNVVTGSRNICDLDQTDLNKAVISEFIDVILVKNQIERIGEFMPWGRFIGHNPLMKKGRLGFAEFVETESKHKNPMIFHEVLDMVGKGNFVAFFGRVSFRGSPYKVADLFRLENGQIIEHWDVAEKLTDVE